VQSIETLWKAGDDRLKFKRAAKERQVLELWQKKDREFRLKLILKPFIKQFRIELLSFPIERFPQIGYWIAKEMLREYSPSFGELVWPSVQRIIKERMIQLKDE
jgi:hypothetical protein